MFFIGCPYFKLDKNRNQRYFVCLYLALSFYCYKVGLCNCWAASLLMLQIEQVKFRSQIPGVSSYTPVSFNCKVLNITYLV